MTDRAVSVQINYVLGLVIVTILLTGVLMSTNSVLRDQRRDVVRSEVQVIGNRVASDISAADQIVAVSGGTSADELTVSSDVPAQFAGVGYSISVWSEANPGYWLVHVGIDSDRLDVNETMSLKTQTPVANDTVTGGSYTIAYVDSDGDTVPDKLEVQSSA